MQKGIGLCRSPVAIGSAPTIHIGAEVFLPASAAAIAATVAAAATAAATTTPITRIGARACFGHAQCLTLKVGIVEGGHRRLRLSLVGHLNEAKTF